MKLKILIIFFNFFFAKPNLLEFLLIMIVLFLIPTSQVQFTPFCSGFSKFVPVWKIFTEVKLLGSIFKCSNYPVNKIDQFINKFLDKLYVSKQIIPTVPKREFLVAVPFLGTFSLNLIKRLYKSVSKSLPQCNLIVIFQSKNRFSSFFKLRTLFPYILGSVIPELQNRVMHYDVTN